MEVLSHLPVGPPPVPVSDERFPLWKYSPLSRRALRLAHPGSESAVLSLSLSLSLSVSFSLLGAAQRHLPGRARRAGRSLPARRRPGAEQLGRTSGGEGEEVAAGCVEDPARSI
eukprot:scaffold3256_cov444-Prasinococcus_capsulatus_cf.AAC.13